MNLLAWYLVSSPEIRRACIKEKMRNCWGVRTSLFLSAPSSRSAKVKQNFDTVPDQSMIWSRNAPVAVQPLLQILQGELISGLVLAVAWAPPLNGVVGEVDKLNTTTQNDRGRRRVARWPSIDTLADGCEPEIARNTGSSKISITYLERTRRLHGVSDGSCLLREFLLYTA